jgi:hypothetical protein
MTMNLAASSFEQLSLVAVSCKWSKKLDWKNISSVDKLKTLDGSHQIPEMDCTGQPPCLPHRIRPNNPGALLSKEHIWSRAPMSGIRQRCGERKRAPAWGRRRNDTVLRLGYRVGKEPTNMFCCVGLLWACKKMAHHSMLWTEACRLENASQLPVAPARPQRASPAMGWPSSGCGAWWRRHAPWCSGDAKLGVEAC